MPFATIHEGLKEKLSMSKSPFRFFVVSIAKLECCFGCAAFRLPDFIASWVRLNELVESPFFDLEG
jgi:hypothetical protein